MKYFVPFAAVLACSLAACTQEPVRPAPPPPPSPPQAAVDECGAGKLAAYLSQPATDDVLAKLRHDAGHDKIRVIRPGQPVTMDYRPDRLNVEVGEDGRITKLHCV